jgi:hypothetical protein
MKTKRALRRSLGIGVVLLALTGILLVGCATTAPEKPKVLVPTDRETAVYLDKYEFKAPLKWALMRNVEGGDFELGFLRIDPGVFPSQTMIIYDDEPFGSSQDLEVRGNQYCTRFLFNSGMSPQAVKREKTQLAGSNAIAIYLEGENPVQKEKVKSKVYLFKKGNRVLSFLCTQWRPLDGQFDLQAFETFETFAQSFKFLKKSFYEEFEEELQKLKG